jgi:hypothetical protein
MTESQPKLQGTKNGWFQWLLSDNKFQRIEPVDSIESLLERHQAIQDMGIDHVVVLESGNSNFLPELIAKDQKDIKVIFRNRFPADVVNLLCQPDADILSAWQEICQSNPKKIHHPYFKNRTLVKAYGKSLNDWFKTLHQDDLINYLPAPDRFFLTGEFTYIGIEKGTLVFALTGFPSAWLTLKNRSPSEIKVKANYAGAFLKGPKLKLFWGQQLDWNKPANQFWMKWLKHFRISKNDLEEAGFWQSNTWIDILQKTGIIVVALPSIAVIALMLRLMFQYPILSYELINQILQHREFILHEVFQENEYFLAQIEKYDFEQEPRGEYSPTQNIHDDSLSSYKISYEKGYNLEKLTAENDKEFVLFWQLGKWIRLLDEGCSYEKVHPFNFEKQNKVANKFIQAFEIYDPSQTGVVNELKEMRELLSSQNDISQNDLCDELVSYRQYIFNHLSD